MTNLLKILSCLICLGLVSPVLLCSYFQRNAVNSLLLMDIFKQMCFSLLHSRQLNSRKIHLLLFNFIDLLIISTPFYMIIWSSNKVCIYSTNVWLGPPTRFNSCKTCGVISNGQHPTPQLEPHSVWPSAKLKPDKN